MDAQGSSPLHQAIRSDKPDVVGVLLERNANINVQDKAVIVWPVGDCMRLDLARRHVFQGHTPLSRAIQSGGGRLNLIVRLVQSKADPNVCNNSKQSPLHLAALKVR